MATDPTPTIDQQVAFRPGQTAPVPLPEALQPSAPSPAPHPAESLLSPSGTVAMLSPDGSQSGEVPLHRVREGRAAGYHIAVPMSDPNGQSGWVPYHRLTDAVSAGYKHLDEKAAPAVEGLANLTKVAGNKYNSTIQKIRDVRSAAAQKVNDFLISRIPNFDSMPPETQADMRELWSQGVGVPTLGLLVTGPSKVPSDIEHPLMGTLPPVGLHETGIPREGVPPEITAGVHDVAIKKAGAIPGGIQKGAPEEGIPDYAMFHDPKSGSSLMLPTDQVTPENVTAQLEKSRAAYAAADKRAVQKLMDEEGAKAAAAAEESPENLIMAERQSPLKQTYKMGIVSADGKPQSVTVDAFSYKDALKQAKKQFPEAQGWTTDASKGSALVERPPSTDYVVPTGKHLSMPESTGRTEEDTRYHELGHFFTGANENIMEQGGMLRYTHPDMPSNGRAAIEPIEPTEGLLDRIRREAAAKKNRAH
jgi:hypothetical protein